MPTTRTRSTPSKARGRKPRETVTAPALAATAPHPFVHVGAGVSAARKSWWLAIALRDPLEALAASAIKSLALPKALDTLEARPGRHVVLAAHDADSLQWVVATSYPGPGPRADQGEPTDVQWRAFNADVDAFLLRIHALAPVAVVVRTVDDEYSTELSDWHTWSCRELPRYLPFLGAAFTAKDDDWLEQASDLFRAWLATLPLDEQKHLLAHIGVDARAVLKKHGGVPKPVAPSEPADEPPSLDDQRAAWARIAGSGADVVVEFQKAFAHLRLEDDGKWDLLYFLSGLQAEPTAANDALAVEVVRAALASPSVEWPNTLWRPDLVDSLVRLGRLSEARSEVALVAMTAESYSDGNWCSLIGYLDAIGKREDANVLYRVANRYVTGFDLERKGIPRAAPEQKAEASRVLLELCAPALADLGALGEEVVRHAAFLFRRLVEAKVADDKLMAESKRLNAAHDKPRKKESR
jgi:hypothetical protein